MLDDGWAVPPRPTEDDYADLPVLDPALLKPPTVIPEKLTRLTAGSSRMVGVTSLGFLTVDRETYVSGRERGKLLWLTDTLAYRHMAAAFQPHTPAGEDLVRRALTLAEWMAPEVLRARGQTFADLLPTHLAAYGHALAVHDPTGRAVANAYETGLNSIIAAADAPLALITRINGQCERNAWIAGEHRAWAADLIEQAMATEFPPHLLPKDWSHLHPGAPLLSDAPHWKSKYDGWAAVIDMLRATDEGIVVLDYSVTGGWPSPKWALWPEPEDAGGQRFRRWWNKAGQHEQWWVCERRLRACTRDRPMLQITPGNLHTTGFGSTAAYTWQQLADLWIRDRDTQPSVH